MEHAFGSDWEGNGRQTARALTLSTTLARTTSTNIIATSDLHRWVQAQVNLTGSGEQDWVTGFTGAITGSGFYGFLPAQPGAGSTFTTTASGYMEMYLGGAVKYIPYFNTKP